MTISDFDALLGTEADFYGVDLNKFKLDDVVWEALEDEDDGYRSMLDAVICRGDASDGIFFVTPLARVRITDVDNGFDEYYQLIDVADNHCWLSFGTDDYYDWYPCFRFDYTPKLEAQR